jgi:DNA-binding response OmpR family regulator
MGSSDAQRSANADLAPGERPPGSARVLVVERDPHLRALETHFLVQAGYTVEFASDGQAGLEAARASLPDVVITEILVARLDGLALCRQLKADEKTRGIAVVVFSILASTTRAKEAGADAFLMKPLAEHRLLGTVRRLLDERSPASRPPGPAGAARTPEQRS